MSSAELQEIEKNSFENLLTRLKMNSPPAKTLPMRSRRHMQIQ
ncbi:hypothetical protein I3842_13G081800 [Carya illinoinensis]|uniref:Uncharacterized protein n=1 Tax=Carya illinoinensis TaxID=32201 RepID=A0A922AIH2_CARIL|nr:hypothetical protein I3842_13G081800 [Carya illinoinensis]